MPKSVTTVTAAHISTLIDSVQAVVGWTKPRLMGEGMRMIVWGRCQPRSRCTWSVEQEFTQPILLPRFFGSTLATHPLCFCHQLKRKWIQRKVIPFIRLEELDAINTGEVEWWSSSKRQCKDLDCGIVKEAEESKIPPLWPSERTTVALISFFSERVFNCALWLSLVWMRVDWFSEIPLNLFFFFLPVQIQL